MLFEATRAAQCLLSIEDQLALGGSRLQQQPARGRDDRALLPPCCTSAHLTPPVGARYEHRGLAVGRAKRYCGRRFAQRHPEICSRCRNQPHSWSSPRVRLAECRPNSQNVDVAPRLHQRAALRLVGSAGHEASRRKSAPSAFALQLQSCRRLVRAAGILHCSCAPGAGAKRQSAVRTAVLPAVRLDHPDIAGARPEVAGD